jgi:hypothetical protein
MEGLTIAPEKIEKELVDKEIKIRKDLRELINSNLKFIKSYLKNEGKLTSGNIFDIRQRITSTIKNCEKIFEDNNEDRIKFSDHYEFSGYLAEVIGAYKGLNDGFYLADTDQLKKQLEKLEDRVGVKMEEFFEKMTPETMTA